MEETIGPIAGVTALVLLSWQPTQRIDYHLYLSDNGESQAVRRAFQINSNEPARSMSQRHWRRITEQHEAIRAEINELADVVIHDAPLRLADHAPLYAFGQYEEPKQFGWITSPHTGKKIRAWHNTWGILRHIRYVTRLAHRQLVDERPTYLMDSQTLSLGGSWGENYGLTMHVRGVDPDLKAYPPPPFCVSSSMTITAPWMQIKIQTPNSYERTTERTKRLMEYMDMNTGLIVGGIE